MARFGVEEEFMLLDRHRLAAAPRGAEVQQILERNPELATDISSEFLAAQVEHVAGIHDDLAMAGADLLRFRTALVEAARDLDVVVVATGTPFDAGSEVAIRPTERYLQIAVGDLIDARRCSPMPRTTTSPPEHWWNPVRSSVRPPTRDSTGAERQRAWQRDHGDLALRDWDERAMDEPTTAGHLSLERCPAVVGSSIARSSQSRSARSR